MHDPHTPEDPAPLSHAVGLGGLSAACAGALFVVWGYSHSGDMAPYLDPFVKALAFAVPMLFLFGLVGYYARCRGLVDGVGKAGFVLCFLGSVWGVVLGVVDYAFLYRYISAHGFSPLFLNWLPWLFTGLTLVCIAGARTGPPPRYGGLLPMMVLSGWIYYATDYFGEAVGARLGHVLFGLLFSMGWVMLGRILWAERGVAT